MTVPKFVQDRLVPLPGSLKYLLQQIQAKLLWWESGGLKPTKIYLNRHHAGGDVWVP